MEADLGNTLGASPVSNRDFIQRWKETERVIGIITAIAEQQKALHVSTIACSTEVLIHCLYAATTIKLAFLTNNNNNQINHNLVKPVPVL